MKRTAMLAAAALVVGALGIVQANVPILAPEPSDALRAARAATEQQALDLGVTLPAPAIPAFGSPSASLLAFWAARGHLPSAADLGHAAAADALPAPAAAAFTRIVGSFLAFEAATHAALDGVVVPEEGASARELWRAAGASPAPILAARLALLEAALDFRTAAQGPLPPLHFQSGLLAVDTLGVDDAYAIDMVLTLDVGGDDVYTNNAGGSRLLDLGRCWFSFGAGTGAAALLDFGGDDLYASPGGCGVLGGGYHGSGFLFDGAGTDRYLGSSDQDTGANDGANGGGARLGLGFLLDDGVGDEVYTAGGWGSNGAGYVGGLGMLLDQGGDDRYDASYDGFNGEGVLGLGLLHDAGGHDLYRWHCHDECQGAWDQTIVPKGFGGAQIDR